MNPRFSVFPFVEWGATSALSYPARRTLTDDLPATSEAQLWPNRVWRKAFALASSSWASGHRALTLPSAWHHHHLCCFTVLCLSSLGLYPAPANTVTDSWQSPSSKIQIKEVLAPLPSRLAQIKGRFFTKPLQVIQICTRHPMVLVIPQWITGGYQGWLHNPLCTNTLPSRAVAVAPWDKLQFPSLSTVREVEILTSLGRNWFFFFLFIRHHLVMFVA